MSSSKQKKIFRYQAGTSTLEIVIAMAILVLTLSAVIIVHFSNQSITIDTQTNSEAIYKAQTQLESIRAAAKSNFSSINLGTYCDDNSATKCSGSLDPSYTRTVTVTDCLTSNPDCKQVTSTVTWKTDAGRNQIVSFSTLLTNPAAGEVCSPTLADADAWKTPQHWDFSPTTLIPGNQSNGFGISDMRENKGELYMTAYSPMNNGYTLVVFDLPTDPSVPPTYAGGVVTNSQGLNAVAIGKNGTSTYAYVASSRVNNFTTCTQGNDCAQLQVVDVSSPVTSGWNPTIKNFKVPGIVGSGGQGIGNTVFYDNGYVYLGLVTGGGPEFQIIDVHTPLLPVPAGSYPVGRTVEDIFVKGNFAYVTTDDNTGTNKQLLVLDISDKNATPLPVATYFKVSGAGFGRTVSVNNNQIYMGRTYISGSPTLYIIDGSDLSTSPLPMLGKVNGADNVLAVAGRGSYLFALTDAQFQVWDISSPGSPAPWSSDGTTNTFMSLSAVGGSGTTFNCSGNYFYTAVKSSQGQNKDTATIIGPGKANQTITVNTHAPASAGLNSTFQVAATSSSGLSVAITTTGGCSISGGTVTMTSGTNSCTVHYDQSGNYAYNAAAQITEITTASKADQTITFGTLADKTFGDPDFNVSGSASSGLTVSFASQTPGICTVSGSTVHIVSAGTCTVRASQAGDGNYNPAPNVDQSFTVNKATPTITWSNPANITYGTPLSGTQLNASTGGVAGTFTYTPASGTVLNAGPNQTLSVHFVPTNTSNYNTPADKTVSITVNKATPTITWSNPANITYGTPLSGTQLNASTGGVAGTFTYTPASGTVLNAGPNQTLSVHFVPTNTSNYNTPADKTVSITVNKATPTISTTIFNALTNVAITHAPAGTSVYDKATLTWSFGTPTGTVTFTVSTNKINCGNPTQGGGTGTLASGVTKSSNYTTGGNTSYQAVYSGDINFNSVAAVCEALPAP